MVDRRKRTWPKKKPPIRRICQQCKIEFKARRKEQKFCSLDCSKLGKKKWGKPKVDLVELLSKIKPFLQLGLSIRQACLNAKVSYDTVIEKKNDTTEETQDFRDGIEVAKNFANVKARQVVIGRINEGDDYNARWWLNKTDPDFKDKQTLEHEGGVNVTMEWGIPRSPYVDPGKADDKK